ncbi:MAG: hypothetical protein ACJ8J0_25625 [Longimicrobiaceae bacterium]
MHILRKGLDDDGRTAIHAGRGDAWRLRKTRFPLMTQLPKPSGAEDGVNDGSGCSEKNFDTQRIPSLQPLVDEPGADAIVGTHIDEPENDMDVCGGQRGEERRHLVHRVPGPLDGDTPLDVQFQSTQGQLDPPLQHPLTLLYEHEESPVRARDRSSSSGTGSTPT